VQAVRAQPVQQRDPARGMPGPGVSEPVAMVFYTLLCSPSPAFFSCPNLEGRRYGAWFSYRQKKVRPRGGGANMLSHAHARLIFEQLSVYEMTAVYVYCLVECAVYLVSIRSA
jgi:hypothetical protein